MTSILIKLNEKAIQFEGGLQLGANKAQPEYSTCMQQYFQMLVTEKTTLAESFQEWAPPKDPQGVSFLFPLLLHKFSRTNTQINIETDYNIDRSKRGWSTAIFYPVETVLTRRHKVWKSESVN